MVGRFRWLFVLDSFSSVWQGFASTSALSMSLSDVTDLPDQEESVRSKLLDPNLRNHLWHLRTSCTWDIHHIYFSSDCRIIILAKLGKYAMPDMLLCDLAAHLAWTCERISISSCFEKSKSHLPKNSLGTSSRYRKISRQILSKYSIGNAQKTSSLWDDLIGHALLKKTILTCLPAIFLN